MYWLGPDYQESGVAGNDIRRTNVPAIRIAYRFEALCEELRLLGNAYKSRQEVNHPRRIRATRTVRSSYASFSI